VHKTAVKFLVASLDDAYGKAIINYYEWWSFQSFGSCQASGPSHPPR